jgi:hypothetical protein
MAFLQNGDQSFSCFHNTSFLIPIHGAKIGTILENSKFLSDYFSLRLTKEVYDAAHGLGGVELGVGRLVAVLQRFHQHRAPADPTVQVVLCHMRFAVGEV